MNHLTLNMLIILLEKVAEWTRDEGKRPKAIIMEGAGEKAFCSGGDMKGLYDCY